MPLSISKDPTPITDLKEGELFIGRNSRPHRNKIFMFGKRDGNVVLCGQVTTGTPRAFSTRDLVHRVEETDAE